MRNNFNDNIFFTQVSTLLSFSKNNFLIKFSILFFVLVIFSFWGIDLNSEEIYIAFSFFFLTILAFVLVRSSLLFFFVKFINSKYSRILNNLVFIYSLEHEIINQLRVLQSNFFGSQSFLLYYFTQIALLVKELNRILVLSTQIRLSNVMLLNFVGLNLWVNSTTTFKKFNTFSLNYSKLFKIIL